MTGRTIQEQFDLTGKVALVTGATGYLGTAFSHALAEAGASVVISSRDGGRAQEAAAKLPSPGGAVHHGVTLDQMDGQSVQDGFAEAIKAAGQVDILINNGLAAQGKDLTEISMPATSPSRGSSTTMRLSARFPGASSTSAPCTDR
jgi:NAD(P)-dependent dehydrogenase (short-subunit alcohol dehydrogenase family)